MTKQKIDIKTCQTHRYTVIQYHSLEAFSLPLRTLTFHDDGCKQGIDQQIFNRKSISRKITHLQSSFKQKD